MKEILNAMTEAQQHERAKYHLTLDEAIEQLFGIEDKTRAIQFSDGSFPDGLHSYRGYYEDLAISPCNFVVSVNDLFHDLSSAAGSEFTGYKGGDFIMGDRTPLWQASRGDIGRPILSIDTEQNPVQLVLGDN